MDSAKNRSVAIPLGIIVALVVNAILFMGLPLLTQIQRSYQGQKFDDSMFLTAHKPPKPPDPLDQKKKKIKKPKKIVKDKAKQKAIKKPKIDIPKFDFSMGAGDLGGLQIAAFQQQSLSAGMFRTAFTLSEVDQPPRIIRRIDPLYPFAAKRKNIQGKVTLRFIVTKEGRVIEPSVVKAEPPGIFDNSALKAILRWRFKPAIKDGKAVDVIIIAPLKFELIK